MSHESRVYQLLKQYPVGDMDHMSRGQLARVAQILSGTEDRPTADADLVQNWRTLRNAFPNASELEQLLRGDPQGIARFLIDGPKSQTHSAAPAASASAGGPSATGARENTQAPGMSHESRVYQLLKQHPVGDMDHMSRGQLARVAQILSGTEDRPTADADLVQNWRTLRNAFPNASELEQLLRGDPQGIARFLIDGPKSQTHSAAPAASASAEEPGRPSTPPPVKSGELPKTVTEALGLPTNSPVHSMLGIDDPGPIAHKFSSELNKALGLFQSAREKLDGGDQNASHALDDASQALTQIQEEIATFMFNAKRRAWTINAQFADKPIAAEIQTSLEEAQAGFDAAMDMPLKQLAEAQAEFHALRARMQHPPAADRAVLNELAAGVGLNLPPLEADASPADLKKLFHKLSLKLHPDMGGNAADFDQMQASYKRLVGDA